MPMLVAARLCRGGTGAGHSDPVVLATRTIQMDVTGGHGTAYAAIRCFSEFK